MAKVISQETYDEVIGENIVMFSMSVEEARQETIEQFEAQGINLANIIKDLTLNVDTGKPVLVECIEKLKAHSSGNEVLNDDDFERIVSEITIECDKSVPHRVMAAKNGAFQLIADLCETHKQDIPRLNVLLLANSAVINKQPDVFTKQFLTTIKSILTSVDDKLTLKHSLRCLQRACLMHENNRQMIVEADFLTILKPFLRCDECFFLKEVCCLFRFLVLDDDIRVEFGKAHDHARLIAGEVLEEITLLLNKFKKEQELIGELMLTIASLTVRNELCLVVETAGGLQFTMELMREHPDNPKVIREGLKLLKALAGNDKIKVDMVQQGAAPLITSLLNMHKAGEGNAKLALGCISTIALRVNENGLAFFDAGAAEVIVETMKIHAGNMAVVRNASWAIRNMVARNRDRSDLFLIAGAEDCLNAALKEHPSIQQDVKSALRDLGAKVHLAEEWKTTAEKAITKDF